jgi:hypothetical protein
VTNNNNKQQQTTTNNNKKQQQQQTYSPKPNAATNLRHHITLPHLTSPHLTSPHLTSSLPPSISGSKVQGQPREATAASPHARALDSRTPSPVELTPLHRPSARPPTSTQPERRRTPKHAKARAEQVPTFAMRIIVHTRQMRNGRVATG